MNGQGQSRSLLMSVVALTFLLIAPSFVFGAGSEGGLKSKIQSKLNKTSNVQYEPYYLEANRQESESWGGVPNLAQRKRSDARVMNKQVGGQQAMPVNASAAAPAGCDALKEKKDITRPPSVAPAPSYAIYNMKYQAELEENVVTVKGDIVFEVFGTGTTQLPLVSNNVGLIDVRVNKGASFVTSQGGKYYLIMHKPGRYKLDFEFLIKAARERERGPGSFSVDVIPAPISQFEFTIPEKDTQIFVEPAIKVETKSEEDKTSAWAVLPNTNSLSVRWTKALPKEEIVSVKVEPKVYAETSTYSSIGGGVIRSVTNINYSILQSEVSSLRVLLPEDVSVLDVNGKDLRDWKVSTKDKVQTLDVFLNFGVKGNYALNVTFEKNIAEGSGVVQMPWVKVAGVERENGYYGIAANTNVELAVKAADKVTAIDTKQLPSSIWSSSTSPILLAFKYLNPPFDIAIEMTRHEEVPVLIAAIDAAEHVTLYTKDGKVLTKATYQVRNNVKQFLRLDLPAKSKIWSSFVAGKPVKPAVDKAGHILIPLEKSQLQGGDLTRFPVEVVYLAEGTAMKGWGNLRMALPKVDVPINEFYWSVFLPYDYTYFNFGGDVRKVGSYSGIVERAPFVGDYLARATQGRLADDIGDQYSEGNTRQGVLPITINVPQQGQSYRFSKLLVVEGESPWVRISYSSAWSKVRPFVKFVVYSLIIFLFARMIVRKIMRKRNK